jgi:hypothetical protein
VKLLRQRFGEKPPYSQAKSELILTKSVRSFCVPIGFDSMDRRGAGLKAACSGLQVLHGEFLNRHIGPEKQSLLFSSSSSAFCTSASA